MNKTKLAAFLFNLYSISAVAGYQCDLQLSHSEDLYQVIAQKTLSIEAGEMRSGNMGTLFVEAESKKKKTSLDINAMMSGWKGEEDATFVILRRTVKKRSTEANTVSQIVTIEGKNQTTLWFDSYKLEIDCDIK